MLENSERHFNISEFLVSVNSQLENSFMAESPISPHRKILETFGYFRALLAHKKRYQSIVYLEHATYFDGQKWALGWFCGLKNLHLHLS